MKTLFRFHLAALSPIFIAALLAGCGGSQPPIGAPGTMSYGASGQTAMQPTRAATKDPWSGDLLYVATGGDVYVLLYPSGKVVGRLGASAYSLCSDKRGNVFLVGGDQTVTEYSHSGKLVETLAIYDVPSGCGVDPTTGNLAVPTYDYSCVYIFPGAQSIGVQSICNDEFTLVGLCAYDNDGNLFLDGAVGGGPHHSYIPGLAELPKGSTTFRNYLLPSRFGYDDYDSVSWDGAHIALSNPNTHSIYRMHVAHKAKIVGTTHVHGWVGGFGYGGAGGTQTWLKDGMFIAQWHSNSQLAIWSYPAGGRPIKMLPAFAGSGTSVDGVVLSRAPH
jgi:hypothetical protein